MEIIQVEQIQRRVQQATVSHLARKLLEAIRDRDRHLEVGTAASGDRNHPGRPGERGGSAPSISKVYEDDPNYQKYRQSKYALDLSKFGKTVNIDATVYHGTGDATAQRIRDNGFKNPDYDLTFDKLAPGQKLARESFGKGIYLTDDLATAKQFAAQASDYLNDDADKNPAVLNVAIKGRFLQFTSLDIDSDKYAQMRAAVMASMRAFDKANGTYGKFADGKPLGLAFRSIGDATEFQIGAITADDIYVHDWLREHKYDGITIKFNDRSRYVIPMTTDTISYVESERAPHTLFIVTNSKCLTVAGLREVGTASSGDRNHPGRPHERGGSLPSRNAKLSDPATKRGKIQAAMPHKFFTTDYRVKMIEKALDEATDSERRAGMQWYEDAHKYGDEIAAKYNISQDKAYSLIAALSVQMNWDNNKLATEEFLRDPQGYYDKAKAFVKGDSSPMHVGTGATGQGVMQRSLLNAGRIIIDNEKPYDVLNGKEAMKTFNFYQNIKDPSDPQWITIDRHAVALSVDKEISASELKGLMDTPPEYKRFQMAYREVAAERNMLANDVQAITWTHWSVNHARAVSKSLLKKRGEYAEAQSQLPTKDDPQYAESFCDAAQPYALDPDYQDFFKPPFKEVGTASSGDRGHADVPGRRGGSAPSGKQKVLYHVTLASNVPSIMKDGLVPQVGERSNYINDTQVAVHLFADGSDVEDAVNEQDGWLNHDDGVFAPEDKLAVLRVTVPARSVARDKSQSIGDEEENNYTWITKQTIPPDAIKVMTLDVNEDGTGMLEVAMREVGTSSSGDHDHPGNPGHVGGSGPSFNADQKWAIKDYTGFASGSINGILRGTFTPDSEHVEGYNREIAALDSAMHPLNEQIVYRALGAQVFGSSFPAPTPYTFDWSQFIGKSFADKGFVSTSSDFETAKVWDWKGAVAEIHVPEGIRGVAIPDEFASNPDLHEHEVLLDRGLTYTIRGLGDPILHHYSDGSALDYTVPRLIINVTE